MSRRLRVDIIQPTLPPAHDAIGEYTVCLCQEMSQMCDVQLLTGAHTPQPKLGDFPVQSCFQLLGRNRLSGLATRLCKSDADAVILQYNPFSWGHRGWAPDLVDLIRSMKGNRPDVCMCVMFHETYMSNPGWKAWVMRQYQRRQYHDLVELADIGFFSTDTWGRQVLLRSPHKRVVHAPVGSNLPESKIDCTDTRALWNIRPDDFVCGVFGGAHPSRLIGWIKAAVRRINILCPGHRRVVLLHVGGEPIDWSVIEPPVVATGRLFATEAADAIAAMDLLINPFRDGISTRRGSSIAALQQGVPVLSTTGKSTDALWSDFDGSAVFLAAADDLESWTATIDIAVDYTIRNRETASTMALQAYRKHFAWPVVARKFHEHLLSIRSTERSQWEAVKLG